MPLRKKLRTHGVLENSIGVYKFSTVEKNYPLCVKQMALPVTLSRISQRTNAEIHVFEVAEVDKTRITEIKGKIHFTIPCSTHIMGQAFWNFPPNPPNRDKRLCDVGTFTRPSLPSQRSHVSSGRGYWSATDSCTSAIRMSKT